MPARLGRSSKIIRFNSAEEDISENLFGLGDFSILGAPKAYRVNKNISEVFELDSDQLKNSFSTLKNTKTEEINHDLCNAKLEPLTSKNYIIWIGIFVSKLTNVASICFQVVYSRGACTPFQK